jgi:hypothetical protein
MTLVEEKEKLLREIWTLNKDNVFISKQERILRERRDSNYDSLAEINKRLKQIERVYDKKK